MTDLIRRDDAYAAIRGLTRHIDRIAAITALPAVQPMTVQETARCEYCDGTGDVHAIDGEWRGYCSCGAGATIRALPAVQPKVKPLVWVSEGPWDKAVCSYGTYYIQYDDETQAWFASLELGEVESPIILSPSDVPNWGDAEAAAHADYEARILSALEPAVQPDAALLEAACVAAHNAYEAAAHEAGWTTNTQSRKPWAEVPEANKVAMRAGIGAALTLIDIPAVQPDAAAIREAGRLLDDIVCGRGMFGVDPAQDLQWAMETAGAALALIDKPSHVSETPKIEHVSGVMLTPATGDA